MRIPKKMSRIATTLTSISICFSFSSRAVFSSTISTVAGGGPDGLAALSSNLDAPAGAAAGNFGVYYVSAGNRVYAVNTLSNAPTMSVLAGNGRRGNSGDGGLARSAALNRPTGLALDGAFLYVADAGNHSIRKIDLKSGIISRIAGNGASGHGADSGPALSASFDTPISVAVDLNHQVYFGDALLDRVYRVDGNGQISRIAGTGNTAFVGDGGLAVNAGLSVEGIAIYRNLLYIADQSNFRVRVVDFATSRIDTFAGKKRDDVCAVQGPPTSVCLGSVTGLAVNGAGEVFVGDLTNHNIWYVQRLADGTPWMKSIAGAGLGDEEGPALSTARFNDPVALASSAAGVLLIADQSNNRLKSLDASFKTVKNLAGNKDATFSGDSGLGIAMSLPTPTGVAVFGTSLYIADNTNRRVYELDLAQTGLLTRIAGDGNPNNDTPDSLPGAQGLAIDLLRNLYLADTFTRVRRKALDGGPFEFFAGNDQVGVNNRATPLEGPAGFVPLFQPMGVAVDKDQNILIADTTNNRIRLVAYVDGFMKIIGGNGSTTETDEVSALVSGFNAPAAVVGAPDGRIFVADTQNNTIRVIGTDGVVHRFAGTGRFGYAGNGQLATQAFFKHPSALLLDGRGGLLVADTENHQIRRIDLTTLIIDAFAGIGGFDEEGYSGDGGDPKTARLSFPSGLAIDSRGIVYIADTGNGRVRAVKP